MDAERIDEFKRIERAAADATAADSLAWYRRSHGLMSEIETRTILEHLRLERRNRVLDAGCGAGRITLAVAPHVAHVTAVDISPGCTTELRAEAGRRGVTNVEALECDLNELDHSGYDRVIAGQVLTSLPDHDLRLDAVTRIRRALVDRGRFVAVVYRWGGLISKSETQEGVERDGRYRFAFTPAGLAGLLREAGFRHTRVRGCVSLPQRLWSRAAGLDVALSHLWLSRWTGRYLIATGVA